MYTHNENPVKTFNMTGPSDPERHYMLPALERIPDIESMVEDYRYFSIYAPKGSGKTTFLQNLTDEINSKGEYYAIYCYLENASKIVEQELLTDIIIENILKGLEESNIRNIINVGYHILSVKNKSNDKDTIPNFLNTISERLDKDLVILCDLSGSLNEPYIKVLLSQIRIVHHKRETSMTKSPRSIALVGEHNIPSYRHKVIYSKFQVENPFILAQNIIQLKNFTFKQIKALYDQHTNATGQIFEESAMLRVWYWSKGQPFLVNALPYFVISIMFQNNYDNAITSDHIDWAANELIESKHPNFDMFNAHFFPRMTRIINSIFSTNPEPFNSYEQEKAYCIKSGLVILTQSLKLRLTNAFISEKIVSIITREIQNKIVFYSSNIRCVEGGRLLVDNLLYEFQFFRQTNALSDLKSSKQSITYHLNESLYTFVLYAFLRKIISDYNDNMDSLAKLDNSRLSLNNAGTQNRTSKPKGKIEFYYASDRDTEDIELTYNNKRYVIEVRLKGHELIEKDVEQLSIYLDNINQKEGWVVIIDPHLNQVEKNKVYWQKVEYMDKTIHLVGC
jgi:hypothetical protein